MKKKIILLTTVTVMAMALVACGGSSDKKNKDNTTVSQDEELGDVEEDTPDTEEKVVDSEVKHVTLDELMEYPETKAEDFDMNNCGDYIEIWEYLGSDSIVVIPKEIEGISDIRIKNFYSENKNITAVRIPGNVKLEGDNLFSLKKELEIAVFEEGITKIPNYTFSECSKLKTVLLPESIEEIGATVFAGATELSEVKIPDKVTELKDWLFQNVTDIRVELGDNITEINDTTFGQEKSNVTLVVTEGSVTYDTVKKYLEKNKESFEYDEIELIIETK